MSVRLDLVGIVVADMGRSLAFYRRLGLDLPSAADQQGHVEVTLPGGIRLAWDTIEVVRSFSDYDVPRGGARMSLAFRCQRPDEVDKRHRELVEAGYRSHVEPFDAFWGQRYATVFDPDGNPVDLFASVGG